MNSIEILKKFIAKSGDLRGLDKPYRYNGYLFATNGHIAVRISDDENIADIGSVFDPQKINALINIDGATYQPLTVDLPPPEKCSLCAGSGKVCRCEDCDGEGEFDYGLHSYICKECDGDGFVDKPDNESDIDCPDCGGDGNARYQKVHVVGKVFDRRYIAILKGLDEIEIQDNSEEALVTLFRFSQGLGIIMPMRT